MVPGGKGMARLVRRRAARPGSLARGAIGYRKPASVLLALRNHVVGREAYDAAFRAHVRRWAFKHPTPADFFRTIDDITGGDLSWFWRAFFYGDDVLDIGVDSARTQASAGAAREATIWLTRHTTVPFPVEMWLRLADGATQDVRLPATIRARGETFAARVPVRADVTGVRLWPDPTVPDFNGRNDTWENPPPAEPAEPVTAGAITRQHSGGP